MAVRQLMCEMESSAGSGFPLGALGVPVDEPAGAEPVVGIARISPGDDGRSG